LFPPPAAHIPTGAGGQSRAASSGNRLEEGRASLCRWFDRHADSRYSTKISQAVVRENRAPAKPVHGSFIQTRGLSVLLSWQRGASVYPRLNSEVERTGTPETRRATERCGLFCFLLQP
jgi:hypothetical protein